MEIDETLMVTLMKHSVHSNASSYIENKTPMDPLTLQWPPSSLVSPTATSKCPANCHCYGGSCDCLPLWVSNTAALSKPGYRLSSLPAPLSCSFVHYNIISKQTSWGTRKNSSDHANLSKDQLFIPGLM